MKKINNESIEKSTKKGVNRYIKLKSLIILIVLLLFNSYAWFIYATKVEGGLTAHVTAWSVDFQVGNEQSITNIVIDISKIYPGMPTYIKKIQVKNKGETIANLSYQFQGLTILGEEYKVGVNCTQEELDNKIATEYPFKISVEISQNQIEVTNGYGEYSVKVEWPFESGNDNLDTYWGEKAYDFKLNNPTESSLKIDMILIAQQNA